VSFATKIWAKTKEFTANIETQRPNERIKWSVSQGMTHTGVVTFHELAPNLTRVLLSFDVEPGSLIEKAARGMRHVKRAARADLHRFKALIEMAGLETGAWRGRIEDGELVEEHDPSYDEQREYADAEDLVEAPDEEDEDEEEQDGEDADEEEPKAERSRRQRRSRNGSQEDERDEEPAAKRARNQPRASSASRASRSRGSSGSRSSSSGRSASSGGRSRSSRGSGGAQASGRGTRSAR
jgi:uncharacterized membrane protein YgcG